MKWNLRSNGYCKTHSAMHTKHVARRCIGISYLSQTRCKNTQGLDEDGYCGVHRRQLHVSCCVCQLPGCENEAKVGYGYCCAGHNPAIPHYNTRDLDGPSREIVEPMILRCTGGIDLYHGDVLDVKTQGFIELDHILEKQCFTFALQNMTLTNEDAAFLVALIRDEYVNNLNNLCLTRTTTNKIKGGAVWAFLDDLRTGHLTTTFEKYLLRESRDGRRLGRSSTRVIMREMAFSVQRCRYKLEAESETPLLQELSNQLNDLASYMGLERL